MQYGESQTWTHIGETYQRSRISSCAQPVKTLGINIQQWALTAGVMEKGCNLQHRIGFGKLACSYALTGCVLVKYFSPAERSRLDLSVTHFFTRNVNTTVKEGG